MRLTERAALLGSAVVLALAASGCGGDSDSGTQTPRGIVDASDTATQTPSDELAETPRQVTSTAPQDQPATTTSATAPEESSNTLAPPTTTASEPTATASAPDDAGEAAPTTTVPRPEASTVEALIALDRPLVIAHAGGDQDYPHSTLYAYTQSAAAGADILELDVQLTSDGVLIVQHDDTVDRTTERTGAVDALTLAEIQALDNAYWFVPGHWGDQTRPAEDYVFRGVRTGEVAPPRGFSPQDFAVPTFREVAERFEHHVLDVEIKIQRGPDGEADPASGVAAARVLASEIAEMRREDSVIVASFDDEVLNAFAAMAPDVLISPGLEAMLGWYLSDQPLDARYRVLQAPFTYEGIEVVQPEVIEKVRGEGRSMWVWLSGTDVLETEEFYADLLSRGVDGVIAGRPALAVAALRDSLE